jgi:hypothetical protein
MLRITARRHIVPGLIAGVAAAALGGAALPTWADDEPTFEAPPFVGYRVGGQFEGERPVDSRAFTVDVEDGGSFGLDLGLYRDDASFYELLYSRQEAGLDSREAALAGVDVRTEYLHFGGTLLFPQDRGYTPYLSLTVGATRLSAQGGDYDSETNLSASLGGGFRFPLGTNLAATLGARAYVTLVDSDTDIFCISTGENASCLLKSSGSTFWQGEAQLGLTARF